MMKLEQSPHGPSSDRCPSSYHYSQLHHVLLVFLQTSPFWDVVSSRQPPHHFSTSDIVSLPFARHDNRATASLQTFRPPSTTSQAAMSSQPPSIASKAAASASKAPSASGQSSPAGSSTQQFFSNDAGQRRSGSSNARSTPAPRNQQISKPKHKQGKKFRPLDEDAEAEQFSMQNP